MLNKTENRLFLTAMAEATKESITLAVLPRARQVMDAIRVKTGVPKAEALARILDWYASLDARLQLAIMNNDQSMRGELIQSIIRDYAGADLATDLHRSAAGMDHSQAVRAAKTLLDTMDLIYKQAESNVKTQRTAALKAAGKK
jgi:hypothetical protein